jgi:hypothetical protein
LAVANVAVFADVLLPGTKVPTAGDVEVHGRLFEFAARNLARGQLPLWNPHVFSGTPGLGDPNAMMLYPFMVVNILLPLPFAITLSAVLHTFLAGFFAFVWALRRGIHPVGAFLAGAMVSFGGPFFARIGAGHLGVVAAMAWSPLVLLVVDELVRRVSLGWMAIGAVAVAMQLLGGHPQYVLYSWLAATLSLLLQLRGASQRGRIAVSFILVLIWGTALAAIQVVPVLDALRENSRGASLALGAAAEFSLNWSALLTLFVPFFFGHGAGPEYWGDWLYWETTPFVGIVGLGLAIYGATYGARSKRRGAGVLALVFGILALGSNTPLFGFLYDAVPPFDRLRASARALFHFSLFAAMLAAVGTDTLLRVRRLARGLVVSLCGAAVLCLAFAGWIRTAVGDGPSSTRAEVEAVLRLPIEQRDSRIAEMAGGDATLAQRLRDAARARDLVVQVPDGRERDEAMAAYAEPYVAAMSVDRWQDLRAWLVRTKGYSYPLEEWADPDAAYRQAQAAIVGLVIAAATCAVLALLFWTARRSALAVFGIVTLGFVELCVFASTSRMSFDLEALRPPALAKFFEEHVGDYRIHHAQYPNSAMSVGSLDIWGYDPFVPARYADYMAFTQGHAEGPKSGSFLTVTRPHGSFAMLRLQYVLAQNGERVEVVAGPAQMPPPLPRVSLLRDYEVHVGREAMLTAMSSSAWDPKRTVLLESEPEPSPEAAGTGAVDILDESPNHLTIEASLSAPALLLVTDAYSEGWRARPVDSISQQKYLVRPANLVLRAVALPAGHHVIRMEYVPAFFGGGVALSLIGLAVLVLVGGRAFVRCRRGGREKERIEDNHPSRRARP